MYHLIDRRAGSSSAMLRNWRETGRFKLGIHLAKLLNNQGCRLWPVVPSQSWRCVRRHKFCL